MITRQATSVRERQAAVQFYGIVGYTGGLKENERIFVVKENDQIIGAAKLSEESGTLVLRGVYVLREKRRQGVGRNLLTFLDEKIGNRECFCLPYSHLKNFYGSISFSEIEDASAPAHLKARMAQYRSSGHDVIMMRRPHKNPS